MRCVWLIALVGLTGCQTPGGVVDTAQAVSKMSTQLNGALADYVTASNARRIADEMRLATEEQESQRRASLNADQFKILDMSVDDNLRGLIADWRAPVQADEGSSMSTHARLAQQFGENSYDKGPLTQVAILTGSLAKPLAAKDQLMAFGMFSKQVYDDLKAAESAATK
jgi:hypothetical protein